MTEEYSMSLLLSSTRQMFPGSALRKTGGGLRQLLRNSRDGRDGAEG